MTTTCDPLLLLLLLLLPQAKSCVLQDLDQLAASTLNSRASLDLPAALQALERMQVCF
jgi:hypothetical protein